MSINKLCLCVANLSAFDLLLTDLTVFSFQDYGVLDKTAPQYTNRPSEFLFEFLFELLRHPTQPTFSLPSLNYSPYCNLIPTSYSIHTGFIPATCLWTDS